MTTPALDQALQLLRVEAGRYCVGLAHDFNAVPQEENQLASGSLVSRRGKTYVLTAAHFLSSRIEDSVDLVFNREDFALPSLPLGVPLPSVLTGKCDHSIQLRPLRVLRCQSGLEDVGAIEIPARAVPAYCNVYALPDAAPARPAVTEEILFAGFPTSHQLTVTNGVQGALARGFVTIYTRVQPDPTPGTWLDDQLQDVFDPRVHFIGTIDPTEMPHGDKLDLHGMSGCGVWRRKREGKVWTPGVELLGLQVSKRGYQMKFNALGALLAALDS